MIVKSQQYLDKVTNTYYDYITEEERYSILLTSNKKIENSVGNELKEHEILVIDKLYNWNKYIHKFTIVELIGRNKIWKLFETEEEYISILRRKLTDNEFQFELDNFEHKATLTIYFLIRKGIEKYVEFKFELLQQPIKLEYIDRMLKSAEFIIEQKNEELLSLKQKVAKYEKIKHLMFKTNYKINKINKKK